MRPSAWTHNSQAPGHPEGQNFVRRLFGARNFEVASSFTYFLENFCTPDLMFYAPHIGIWL